MIPVYWHFSENFGDRLTPWLVEKITGRQAVYCDPTREGPVPYLVTGSILGWSIRKGIVWGAGSAFEIALDPDRMAPPSDSFRIVATRGPLSAAKMKAAGHAPLVFGDPALLVPRFYTPKPMATDPVGILCSWVDLAETAGFSCPIVSTLGHVEPIIDRICSWDVVVTNALHGLVVAVAYGKPVVWTSFSDRVLGDGFKFRDFFASLGIDEPKPVTVRGLSTAQITAAARIYPCELADELLRVCPLPKD